MKKYLILLTTCLVVTGCSLDSNMNAVENIEEQTPLTENEYEEDSTIDESKSVEQIPGIDDISVSVMNVEEEVKLEPLEVTINTLQSDYTNQDQVIVSHVSIDYPVIKNDLNIEGITKINEFFEETAQALYEENNTYATDNLEAITEESEVESTIDEVNEVPVYSEYTVSFEVKYNDYGILSILQNFSELNEGNEEANTYSTGYVFDINTGDRLSINDVLLGTNQEIAELIGTAFINSDKIEERIKNYYEEEILANTQYAEFYIDNTNLNFFYNPNMVVPYNEGMIEASLPLDSENIFKINLINE